MLSILRAMAFAVALIMLGAAGAMACLGRSEHQQMLPLVHAQMTLCKPLAPPPSADDEGPLGDDTEHHNPPPDYSPRNTGHIA